MLSYTQSNNIAKYDKLPCLELFKKGVNYKATRKRLLLAYIPNRGSYEWVIIYFAYSICETSS
jgi:hypothetical protein